MQSILSFCTRNPPFTQVLGNHQMYDWNQCYYGGSFARKKRIEYILFDAMIHFIYLFINVHFIERNVKNGVTQPEHTKTIW